MAAKKEWWQEGIVYQIYPRSFQDANGDGIGDLPGITQQLDYLQGLGVDALWISPCYPSPMADFGYDVSDYTDIDPIFGTMADMDELIAAVHERGMKIILDYVPGHTSDQHAWFIESRSGRDHAKREWYIWHDPAPDGGPPNNWLSRFDGQSAWEWDEKSGQYYLHTFLKQQPDLNWRNPALRDAMLDVLRFWFERGIDGFRVDVSYRVMKDAQFRDNPPNPAWHEGMDPSKKVIETYSKNTPDIHEFNRWLRAVADEYEDRVLVGEINLPLEQLVKHYGDDDEFQLPFNFRLIFTPWQADAVRKIVDEYERLLPEGAWPNWVLGNHDRARFASRVGAAQARVGMMLLLTLRGTPTLYYGDEIGMQDVEIAPEQVQDPWEKYVPGLGLGRDPERTPMQWDSTPNAGFCEPDVEPWLPLANDYEQVNVVKNCFDPHSMLSLTHALINIRRQTPALSQGSYHSLPAPDGIFAYERQQDEETLFIVLNFTNHPQKWPLPKGTEAIIVHLSTHMDREGEERGDQLRLRGDEGVMLRMKEHLLRGDE